MKKIYSISIALVFFLSYSAYAKEVSFTQEDRDRLRNVELKVERLETRADEGLKSVNQRIEGLERSVNQRIDVLQNLMYVVISSIFVQIVGVVGFVLWDRRTALAPSIAKSKDLEEREELLEKALKEYARQEPRLAEIFKAMRIMQS